VRLFTRGCHDWADRFPRRRVDPAVEARILELKAKGDGILKIGRKLGIGTSVVQRVVAATTQHQVMRAGRSRLASDLWP
jgi:hypothetical protein